MNRHCINKILQIRKKKCADHCDGTKNQNIAKKWKKLYLQETEMMLVFLYQYPWIIAPLFRIGIMHLASSGWGWNG
jgi:hypothetical protein